MRLYIRVASERSILPSFPVRKRPQPREKQPRRERQFDEILVDKKAGFYIS